VIKSTRVYQKGKLCEYDSNLILQMLGRAGRPQYDDSGAAVIMTSLHSKSLYDLTVKGAHHAVESQLRIAFIEHVNAEVWAHFRLRKCAVTFSFLPAVSALTLAG